MGACASILKHNETVAEAKKKARESFKNSNESWVYAQTKKKKDFVQNLNKQKSGSKVDFDAIPEDEDKAAKYKKTGRRFEKLWDQNFPLC